jgi:hypothetical protein
MNIAQHFSSGAASGNVRYWPKADIPSCNAHVRFRGLRELRPDNGQLVRQNRDFLHTCFPNPVRGKRQGSDVLAWRRHHVATRIKTKTHILESR